MGKFKTYRDQSRIALIKASKAEEEAKANSGSGGSGAFADITGSPYDNTSLAEELNNKASIAESLPLPDQEWDISANPFIELSLSADTAITITNVINGKSRGIAMITPNGHTLTINGNDITLGAGETWINIIVKLDGSIWMAKDDADIIADNGTPNYVSHTSNAWNYGATWNAIAACEYTQNGYYVNGTETTIQFTKGFKFVYEGNAGNFAGDYEFWVDGVKVGENTSAGSSDAGKVLIEYHPNTSSTKTLGIRLKTHGQYAIIEGITLYS